MIMDALLEFAKILLPAALVLYAMYLTFRSFLQKEMEKKLLDLRMKNKEQVLPIRLQAYERMCLFLERISPKNILPRINDGSLSSGELHQSLLAEIREEWNHNLSQQLYMSDEAWNLVRNAQEEIITIINECRTRVEPESRGIELAKAIIAQLMEREHDPVDYPLQFLKNEIREVF